MKINLNEISLPKKINPCPILEGVVEFRFESSFPYDAIFGIIYNEFKSDFSNLEELPILQLPEAVRRQDPALQYKPYYKLSSEDKKFLFQIGARVFSLINLNPYDGWTIFSLKLKNLIKRIEKMSVVDMYTRVGIRYINGFDFNILEEINLSISFLKTKITDFDSVIRMEVPTGDFVSTLQVFNNAQIKKAEGTVKGSIIDIDTYIKNPKKEIIEIVEQGHDEEKRLFFNLLKEDFINKKLNPEY
ncbi:MAG: TIGR04255 family protein [Bacteroidales bacterium]|jgi:uncharacterized protein (TIGR04255 family)|nr:TIGR04255 family protein [Bacteroidales bacterium]